jgi:hypothetical protein
LIDLVLAVIAGVLGGVAIGKGLKVLGIVAAAIVGGTGAVLGGWFLRDQVLLLVNASGDVGVTATPVEQTALLILAGATEGAILALGAGMAKMMISEHRQK